MRNFAVGVGQDVAAPPGPFVVGRGVDIDYQVLARVVNDDGTLGDWAPFDISTVRFTVEIRAWVQGAAEFLRRETCAKSTTHSAEGFIKHYFACGTTAYPAALQWELVLVDADNVDADTVTGQREYVLLEFRAPIRTAPRTGPTP